MDQPQAPVLAPMAPTWEPDPLYAVTDKLDQLCRELCRLPGVLGVTADADGDVTVHIEDGWRHRIVGTCGLRPVERHVKIVMHIVEAASGLLAA